MKLALLTTLLPFTTALPTLTKRATTYNGGSTATDVSDGRCAPLTVIFARGTSESGTLGSVVGPSLFNALKSSLKSNVNLQGVSYPASFQGNANLGADGGPEMARLANLALKNCPGTKIALAGYSQGAMVVRNSVARSGLAAANVAAVVQFGDPQQKSSIGAVPASKVKQYCASGDAVCEKGTFTITSAHLSYGKNGADAAAFLISTAGVTA